MLYRRYNAVYFEILHLIERKKIKQMQIKKSTYRKRENLQGIERG